MAAVDLTSLDYEEVLPGAYSFGRILRPQTGGALQRIDRLGNRWQFTFRTPPMPIEPDGRRVSMLLHRAVRDGGIVRVRMPGFDVLAPGTPLVKGAVASGRSVPIDGLTPYYPIRANQPISFVSGGNRYFDFVESEVVADGDGEATITLYNLLRGPLADNATVELGVPKMQGAVEVTSPAPWPKDRVTYFEFMVTEEK